MKIVWIVLAILGGLFALFGSVQMVRTFMSADGTTAYGGSSIAASVFPVCLGLILCVYSIQRVTRKS